MLEHQRFPTPIITPSTKAEEGHDEDISKEDIITKGLMTVQDYALVEKYTQALFQRGSEMAAKQGLILVDTKYEFGKIGDTIYLIDEIHTPDSSRYFMADEYEERFANNETQKQLSKEFVREWLMANGFQGLHGQQIPEMTNDFIQSVTERYIELFEIVTGKKFVKSTEVDTHQRIENNILSFLNNQGFV
jgi:phosphoribosylaminoimidazole-succinocarboxamide synthase